MANEIQWSGILTGATEYFCIRKPGTYQYWNTNAAAFENFTVANWNAGYYAIALTETPSGGYHYQGDWPAGVNTAGYYYVEVYKRVGGSVAIGDKAAKMGEMLGYWNGTIYRAYRSDVATVQDTAQTARDLGLALPAAAAGGKGGIPITDAATGTILQGFGAATIKNDLVDAPNATALTAIGTAVWAATTRTLSSFGTLVADVATAVWGATTRTLSAFGFGTPTGEGK
jgi:hypothetical protein